nr:hypothetical protein [Tanacetum cinerariifolium]
MFIHNHKDHLGKFDVKANYGYFLGYTFVSKAFKVFKTRRQQVQETYHVIINECMEAIRFTDTSHHKIRIDDSFRYPPDEVLHEDDPSRQYQVDSDVSYYVIPHGCSLIKLTQENLVLENDQITTQPTKGPSRNNTKISVSILVPDGPQSHISNQASTTHPAPQDRWSKDQHIKLVKIIGDPIEGMLIRSMVAKLTTALDSKCLFADFLSKIEPKKQEIKLRFPTNPNMLLMTQQPLKNPRSAGVHALTTCYEGLSLKLLFIRTAQIHLVLPVCSVQLWCSYLEAFWQQMGLNNSPQFEKLMIKKFKMSMMGELTYFLRLQIKEDDKGISILQEQYTRNLLKKYEISNSSSVKTPMVPPNNLGFHLKGYLDSDYVGCNMDKKSTSGACQILGGKLVCWSAKKQQEFWCMTIAYDPNPSTNENKPCPLKEFIIKFTMMNGKKPLTLDFNTFTTSTDLDYNNGAYVAHPSPEDEKFRYLPGILSNFKFSKDPSKFIKIKLRTHMISVNNQKDLVSPPPLSAKKKKGKSQTMTPTLPKSQGPEASKALSKKRKQPNPKKTPSETKVSSPKPIKGSEQSRSPADHGFSMISNEGMAKTTPHLEGLLGDKDLGGNKLLDDMEPINPTVVNPSGTGAKYHVDQTHSTRLRYQSLTKNEESDEEKVFEAREDMDEDTQMVKYLRKVSRVLFNIITQAQWTQHEEVVVSYVDLKAAIEALKDIQNAIKEDPILNKKVLEATKAYTKNSTHLTELLTLIKNFNFQGFNSSVEFLQAIALTQEENLASWAKLSTSMAWNLGPRMTDVENKEEMIKKATKEAKLFEMTKTEVIKKTCNDDKSLSEILLEYEKEDEFVVAVMKTLRGCRGESFWEEGDDFGVDVLRFHTCLTNILGFLEKFEWWFKQDIDDEEEEDEEGEGGSETMRRCFGTEMRNWNEMIHHHFHQGCHPTDEMRMDDLEWRRRRN